MRDLAQPCVDVWRDGGPVAALRSCAGCCEHFDTVEMGLDGEPQVCARRVWLYRLGRTGIPRRERQMLERDFTGVEPLLTSNPMAEVSKWLDISHNGVHDDGRSPCLVVLGGTPGAGKTVAACWAISRYNAGMPSGRYIAAKSVVDIDFQMRRMQRTPLLVIDQLGHEYFGKNPDWGTSQFEALLDVRYAEMRPTILCGNLTRDDFEKRYGGILADRLRGDGVFHLFRDKSLRRGAP